MKHFILSFLISLLVSQGTLNAQNCFSIIAGKAATKDGSVLIAHNEDDHGDRIFNWYLVNSNVDSENSAVSENLAMDHQQSIAIDKGNADTQKQKADSEKGIKYLWLEMPGMHYSDSYMNEFGVVICSNACDSKEDAPEFTGDGISWELRNTMGTTAKSAREAVRIGGKLVEQYGYKGSGRTYVIADPNEAWMMSVVNGKHWVARRLADNEVAVIPNYYTIMDVNLKDTMFFQGSSDLVSYAQSRGWYHPDVNGKFNFREVYGSTSNLKHLENIGRKWAAINMLSKTKVKLDENFSWSFQPENKLSPADLMKVLANHYEGTELDDTENYQLHNPHKIEPHGICASHNQYGFVAQLRSFMPSEVGNVLWLAPRRPCINAFTPWYMGIHSIQDGYAMRSFEDAISNHLTSPDKPCEEFSNHIYCDYAHFCEQMDLQYERHIVGVQAKVAAFQKLLFEQQKAFEDRVIGLLKKDPMKAADVLTRYTHEKSAAGLRLNIAIFEDGNQ